MKVENPFLVSGYISPDYFCDRNEETLQLTESARLSLDTALFSIRRLGKTDLLHHTRHLLEKDGIKCIYLDVMVTRNTSDFTYELGRAIFNQTTNLTQKVLNKALQIFRSFSPALTTDSNSGEMKLELKPVKPEESIYDLERIFNYIKNSNNKYFIAIDEFQQILNYPEKNFEGFFRSYIQHLNNAAFTYSGSKKDMLLSIFNSSSKPLWQSCSFMELKPIPRELYAEFIIEKLIINRKTITTEALDFIFDATRRITYFVQLTCYHLFNIKEKNIDIETVSKVFDGIISERESYYVNYISLLTQRQLDIVTAIAFEDGIDKPTGKDFISKYHLGSASTIASALDVLIDKEVIYRDENKYYVSDVLFANWLKNKRKVQKVT